MTTSRISSWGPPLLSSMQSCPSSWACWWRAGARWGCWEKSRSWAACPLLLLLLPEELEPLMNPLLISFVLFSFLFAILIEWLLVSLSSKSLVCLGFFFFFFFAVSDLLLVPTSVFFISVNEFKIVKSFFFYLLALWRKRLTILWAFVDSLPEFVQFFTESDKHLMIVTLKSLSNKLYLLFV